MLAPRLDWLLGSCTCAGCDGGQDHPLAQDNGQISLSTENPNGLLTRSDSLDFAFTPRMHEQGLGTETPMPITPRQRDIKDQLQLPRLQIYPVPPDGEPQDSEDDKKRKLLRMYQEVSLDLHTGMYLTQLTADRDYADIHCQLTEDMTTLKLDQSNGRIIEFPLTNVSKVYRIVKNDDKFYTPGAVVPPDRAARSEQIIVVEFLRRKLAFVFKEVPVAQRFMITMELLIRRAQQRQALKSLTPTFPPRPVQDGQVQCPTPRQVYEAMSRNGGVDRKTPGSRPDPAFDRSL